MIFRFSSFIFLFQSPCHGNTTNLLFQFNWIQLRENYSEENRKSEREHKNKKCERIHEENKLVFLHI